jgi:hypothetical protein
MDLPLLRHPPGNALHWLGHLQATRFRRYLRRPSFEFLGSIVRLAPERPVDRRKPKRFAAAEDFTRSHPFTVFLTASNVAQNPTGTWGGNRFASIAMITTDHDCSMKLFPKTKT